MSELPHDRRDRKSIDESVQSDPRRVSHQIGVDEFELTDEDERILTECWAKLAREMEAQNAN